MPPRPASRTSSLLRRLASSVGVAVLAAGTFAGTDARAQTTPAAPTVTVNPLVVRKLPNGGENAPVR